MTSSVTVAATLLRGTRLTNLVTQAFCQPRPCNMVRCHTVAALESTALRVLVQSAFLARHPPYAVGMPHLAISGAVAHRRRQLMSLAPSTPRPRLSRQQCLCGTGPALGVKHPLPSYAASYRPAPTDHSSSNLRAWHMFGWFGLRPYPKAGGTKAGQPAWLSRDMMLLHSQTTKGGLVSRVLGGSHAMLRCGVVSTRYT